MKPKALVLRTAGTNCDQETAYAFYLAGAEVSLKHIFSLRKNKNLNDYQILCIPGGFSYGDDLGAGRILAQELLLWLKDSLEAFLAKGGLILGICNGFQVLVKSGILPFNNFEIQASLVDNDSGRFEARWICLKVNFNNPAKELWLKDLPEVIHLPIAHGEGKFIVKQQILSKLKTNEQIIFKYIGPNQEDSSGYPFNPNGSIENIAGITDPSGKILGMMPHPERFIFKHHYPYWKKQNIYPWGRKIFENAVQHFK